LSDGFVSVNAATGMRTDSENASLTRRCQCVPPRPLDLIDEEIQGLLREVPA
jgi:hypothetical protein